MNTKQFRDMTQPEMLAWGRIEADQRGIDLDDIHSVEGLRTAQRNAEDRRRLIGATRGQATAMVIEANRMKKAEEYRAQCGAAVITIEAQS